LTKSTPSDVSKKRKRTFVDYNEETDDSDLEMDSPAVSSAKKRKLNNSTTMEDSDSGSEYDPVKEDKKSPKESVKTLKAKILKLEAENKRLKEENKKLKSKAFKDRLTPVASARNKVRTPAAIDRMKKKYLKKWATRLPKVAGMKKTKFTGCFKEIVIEDVGFEKDDFEAIFGGKGYLVQPRPDHKPKSTVTIREFSSWSDIEPLFKGDGFALQETLTVSIWRNRNFSKSYFWGNGEAKITAMSACYNKSRKVLSLKFQCERDDVGYSGFWRFM